MRVRRPLALCAALAALAPLASGCGSGGAAPDVAALNTTTTSSAASQTQQPAPTTPQAEQADRVAYARCMRSNGVPGFPDPPNGSADGLVTYKNTVARLARGSKFSSAQRVCAHLLPSSSGPTLSPQQVRIRVAAGLSFARCMRNHGLSHFPDPTAQGELSVAMAVAQGIDVNSPRVLRDLQACASASHGLLTMGRARQALNNYRRTGR